MPSLSSTNETLKQKISRHRDNAKSAIDQKHKTASQWLQQNPTDFKSLRSKSKKLLASASLASSILFAAPPNSAITTPQEIQTKLKHQGYVASDELENDLATSLKSLTPPIPGHATTNNELQISHVIYDQLGIKATPQLEGNRLNHTFGWMGYEQHLKRFPGDTVDQHDQYQSSGIAPGLGAWGYFSHSKSDFDQSDYLKEKYYFAVQTLYLPDWNTNTRQLYQWYKHRKMIAINPENGKAVVGVIADAGPAKFTGKQFGGSPEVMHHLELVYGKKKGKVIVYFVDDQNDQIPLGPVNTNYQIAKVMEG